MAIPPAPVTRAVGDTFSAASYNLEVRDAENFLLAWPAVRAWQSGTGQSLTTGAAPDLILTDENYDYGAVPMHDVTTNNGRLIAPYDGLYEIQTQVMFAANTTGVRSLAVVCSNVAGAVCRATQPTETSGGTLLKAGTHWRCVAGDYFRVLPTQTSGGNLLIVTGQDQTWATLRQIGV